MDDLFLRITMLSVDELVELRKLLNDWWDDIDTGGVREPRRPLPTIGTGAAEASDDDS